MALAKIFPQKLKQARTSKKLTQTALAAKAGIGVSYVSMLERGQRSPPLDTLEALAKALGVQPTSLLEA